MSTRTSQTRLRKLWKLIRKFVLTDLFALVILPTAILVSRFIYSPYYGLYEDDYSRIPQPMGMSWGEIIYTLKRLFTQYVGQGRPLQLASTFTQAYLGSKIGGLFGIYILGFCLLGLNSVLFYLLLKRISSRTFAILGAVIFSVYSADTTQAYLTNTLGVYPSLTFLLLSIHSYLSGYRITSYLLAVCILLTYETPFALMFAVPLLTNTDQWDRKLFRELLINTAILATILLIIIGARLLLGEGRLASLSPLETLSVSLQHMLIGPVVNLGTFVYRPMQALTSFDIEIALVVILTSLAFSIIFFSLDFQRSLHENRHAAPLPILQKLQKSRAELGQYMQKVVNYISDHSHLIIFGILTLILAYPLTLTIRPYAISGRDSRVHFAGVIGASILWSSFIYLLLATFNRPGKTKIIKGALALWLGLTVGFGILVQRDYRESWILQQDLWRDILKLSPDIQTGTTILIDPDGLEDTLYIGANTWNLPMMLEQIYTFPAEWEFYDIPRVYRLTPDWKTYILGEEGLFHLNARTTVASRSYDRAVDPNKVILLSSQGGKLERIQPTVILKDNKIELKSINEPVPDYGEGILFDLLIAP